MSLSRRQLIEAGAATGALAVLAGSPLLAQVVNPPAPQPVPARPRVMVDPVVDPRIVTRARAAFDRHRSALARTETVGIVDFTRASREPRFIQLETQTGPVTRHNGSQGRG